MSVVDAFFVDRFGVIFGVGVFVFVVFGGRIFVVASSMIIDGVNDVVVLEIVGRVFRFGVFDVDCVLGVFDVVDE